MKTLAVKIFDFNDSSRINWILGHLVKEIMLLHELCKERDQFIQVHHLYNQGQKLSGFTMEYCRHGSIRSCSLHLSKLCRDTYPWLRANWMLQISDAFDYLQTRSAGLIIHRDLSVDSVLIDDQLGVKIADFGLSKKINETAISQNTADFQRKRGIDKQLPETINDPLRFATVYDDRYLYGLLVVEAFGQLSIRNEVGDNVEQFIEQLKSGKHVEYFYYLLDNSCFAKISSAEAEPRHLKQTVVQVVQKMAHHIPEQRATFAEISTMWRLCNTGRMEQERRELLKLVQEELNRSMAPELKGQALKILWNTEVQISDDSLIGKGSFAVCHRCHLKSAPNDAPLALKIFKLDEHDMNKRDWHLKHMVNEIKYLHDIGQQHRSFIKVLYVYFHEVMKLTGYAMEYCKHGSLRLFSKRLGTMQQLGTSKARHPWLVASWMMQVSDGFDFLQSNNRGILHRDLAVDNVLIDDMLNARIADFGLSKSMIGSIATQNTMAFDRLRGIERRLPESYDDPLRQPDIFGDRYLYAVLVVEAFGLLSVRQVIGDRIEEFKERVRAGKHVGDFKRLLDDSFFDKIPQADRNADLEQLKNTTKIVVEKMANQVPENRATFAEVTGLWKMCSADRMDQERQRVLDQLNDLPPADTIPSAEVRARTVSLGLIQEDFTAMQLEPIAGFDDNSPNRSIESSNQQPSPDNNVPGAAGVASNLQSAASSSSTPQATSPFTVSIGTVGGDVAAFDRPADGSNVAKVTQHVPAMLGDEVQLLRRTYAEIVATDQLAARLCNCQDLTTKHQVVLSTLGISVIDMQMLQRSTTNPVDLVFQGLLNLIRNRQLTVSQLGETFKQVGCLDGLRILRDYEQNPLR